MIKLLTAIVFNVALGSIAGAQVPDSRIADLVQSGKIRLALFLPGYTKSSTGELRGIGTGAVAVELARALAARLYPVRTPPALRPTISSPPQQWYEVCSLLRHLAQIVAKMPGCIARI